jgi:hypothetical protein
VLDGSCQNPRNIAELLDGSCQNPRNIAELLDDLVKIRET